VVLDLFCGAGFFGLALAADASAVHGFELSSGAVSNAEANAHTLLLPCSRMGWGGGRGLLLVAALALQAVTPCCAMADLSPCMFHLVVASAKTWLFSAISCEWEQKRASVIAVSSAACNVAVGVQLQGSGCSHSDSAPQANAAANGVANAQFRVVDLNKFVLSAAAGVPDPDVVVAGTPLPAPPPHHLSRNATQPDCSRVLESKSQGVLQGAARRSDLSQMPT